MKNIVIFLVIIGVLVFGLSISKDSLIKGAVQSIAHRATGLELKIQSLHLGLLTSLIDIRGLRLMNPSGFKDRVMFDFPEIFVDLQLKELLLQRKIHLAQVRLNLAEVTVVKNKDGRLNLDALKPAGGGKPAEPRKAGKGPEILIDRLELKIGRVVYKDYSAGGAPQIQNFDVNINETHQNVNNIQVLIPLILSRALMHTTIAKLANIDVDKIMSQFDLSGANLKELGLDQFEGVLKGVGEGGESGTAKAVQGIKNILGALGDAK